MMEKVDIRYVFKVLFLCIASVMLGNTFDFPLARALVRALFRGNRHLECDIPPRICEAPAL